MQPSCGLNLGKKCTTEPEKVLESSNTSSQASGKDKTFDSADLDERSVASRSNTDATLVSSNNTEVPDNDSQNDSNEEQGPREFQSQRRRLREWLHVIVRDKAIFKRQIAIDITALRSDYCVFCKLNVEYRKHSPIWRSCLFSKKLRAVKVENTLPFHKGDTNLVLVPTIQWTR